MLVVVIYLTVWSVGNANNSLPTPGEYKLYLSMGSVDVNYLTVNSDGKFKGMKYKLKNIQALKNFIIFLILLKPVPDYVKNRIQFFGQKFIPRKTPMCKILGTPRIILAGS